MQTETVEISMEAKLTIAEVADWYLHLLEVLTQASAVHLDCSRLQRLDAAGAQLLYSFYRQCQQQGVTLNWTGSSPVLADSLRRLGLAESMAIPAVNGND